jgi:hypothetical protein
VVCRGGAPTLVRGSILLREMNVLAAHLSDFVAATNRGFARRCREKEARARLRLQAEIDGDALWLDWRGFFGHRRKRCEALFVVERIDFIELRARKVAMSGDFVRGGRATFDCDPIRRLTIGGQYASGWCPAGVWKATWIWILICRDS